MPHEDKKKKPLQSNLPQSDMSESSDRPHLSNAVMKEVRVNVQNPLPCPRPQTQATKEEEKRSKTKQKKQKTPPGFAVRGFSVDPSLYHLIDEETFGPIKAVLDPARPNILYSTNANQTFKRNGVQGYITDKREDLKNEIKATLQQQYGENSLDRDQAFDIVETGPKGERKNTVDGNKIVRMLEELHGSTYDGASDDDIRTMFYGAMAGYDTNKEKNIRECLQEIDDAETMFIQERKQLIDNNDIMAEQKNKQLDAYDNAQEALAFKRAFYQKELTKKKTKIEQGLVAQKQIYYRHLKRVTEKYGKYLTQMNVFDFMSVNPADQVGDDLLMLQNANLLIRYYPEIVNMHCEEDREFIAMLHFFQKMQHVISAAVNPILCSAPDIAKGYTSDSLNFGLEFQTGINRNRKTKRLGDVLNGDSDVASLKQDLSLAEDLLELSGVPMKGLSKKEGKAYMKSAQRRGLLQNGEKKALEFIGKDLNIADLAQQCRADLNTIQKAIADKPIPGETGAIIKTLCTLAKQFFTKHKPIDLSQLQTICWELMKRCDVMFGPEYDSLYKDDCDTSKNFCNQLEPFLIKLQIILQAQQKIMHIF